MAYHCIACGKTVTKRQHAIQCDVCEHWQHRLCNTGISLGQYRELMYGRVQMEWRCHGCWEPITVDADQEMITESPTVAREISYISLPHSSALSNEVTNLQEDMTPGLNRPIEIPVESFYVDGPILHEAPILEQSLQEPLVDSDVPTDSKVTFEIVDTGTKRGGRKLVSSDGYTYTVKRSKDNYTYWYCPVRNKKIRCHATVSQKGDKFIRGLHGHEHAAEPGVAQRTKIAAQVTISAAETCT